MNYHVTIELLGLQLLFHVLHLLVRFQWQVTWLFCWTMNFLASLSSHNILQQLRVEKDLLFDLCILGYEHLQ